MAWNLVFKSTDHFFKETIYYLFGVCMCVYILFGGLVEVRGQSEEVNFLLLSCGSWGSNSGCQAWQQEWLPAEPFCQPNTTLFLKQSSTIS